jgi:hypothetical protein
MLHELGLQVFPGGGVVDRMPGVCFLAISRTPQQSSMTQRLLELSRATVPGEERRLIRCIVGSIAVAPPEDVPSLCVVVESGSGLVMILHGALEASVRGPNADDRYSGSDVVTWIERSIALPVLTFEVAPDLSLAPPPKPELDLRAGVVSGTGFRLAHVVNAPHGAIEEMPDREQTHGDDNGGDAATDDVLATGFLCSRGHFNGPNTAYCCNCGISMVQLTRTPVQGARPPLGYIVLDDGSTFSLDRGYVIGREPEHGEQPEGRARLLALPDPERQISRRHASIVLDKWDVLITDCHSVNGTYVRRPGDSRWSRLVPGEPTTLRPGTEIRIAERTLVFDSHYRVAAERRRRRALN